MPLLFLFVLLAIADFATLFAIGAKIGLLASLLWIIVSAAFGIHLIRRESLLTLQKARERLATGEIPSDELLAGAAFVFSGILLIAPGFLSDLIGLLCLLPGSSQLLRRWTGRSQRRTGGSGDDSIAGEWQVHRPSSGQTSGQSRGHADSTGANRAGETAKPVEGDYLGKDS